MQPKPKNGRESQLRIYCLGAFRVVKTDGVELLGAGGNQKIWSIFKYLLAHKGKPVPTQRLMELFWREAKDFTETAPLRTALSRLRTQFQPLKGISAKNEYIIYNKEYCLFNATISCWVDSEEFEKKCRCAWQTAPKDRDEAIEIFGEALKLYQGDFLSGDLYAEWAVPFREYYHKMYIQAIQDVATWLIDKNEFHRAYGILKHAIDIDPYIEKFHVLIIKCSLGLADFTTAIDHYTNCTSVFYKELGLSPSLELRSLYKFAVKEQKEMNGFMGNLDEMMLCQDNMPLSFDSEFFLNLIQSERCRISRYGGSACLIILEMAEEQVHVSIESILSVVNQCLRKSDIISQLSRNILGFLLPMTDMEGSKSVLSYINEELRRRNMSTYVTRSKIFLLTPLEQDKPILPRHQRHVFA